MKCPYLGKSMSMCSASMALIAPSIYETKAYCMTEDYCHCPTVLAHVLGVDRDEISNC
ncbi:MAG: hypothetical protein HZB54_06780 [Deltaproteobacteria bacterium]|nr:hypothetical protein [Deltaproteobacteria bacterium]